MATVLPGIEMCVFDAYGTLFDFNSAVARHRRAIGPSAANLSEMWRQKQIQYTWLRNAMGEYAPFWQVTGEALDHCLAAHRIPEPDVRERLMGAYLALDPFPRSRACSPASHAAACGARSFPTAIAACSTRWLPGRCSPIVSRWC